MCFRRNGVHFSTSARQKVVRTRQFFRLLTWKCASRHNGVDFFDISTSKIVFRKCGVCSFFTSKCASRHNGVHLFISHLARCLRTRRFREPTFRPSRATNHWKNAVNRDFPTFSRTCIFFLLSLSPRWFSHFFSSPLWLSPPLLLHLSISSEVWLLNFLRQWDMQILFDNVSCWAACQSRIPKWFFHTSSHKQDASEVEKVHICVLLRICP